MTVDLPYSQEVKEVYQARRSPTVSFPVVLLDFVTATFAARGMDSEVTY